MTDIELHRPAAVPASIGASQWEMLHVQANTLADSSIIPRKYQGKPADIIAAGLMGVEVGWGVMTALQLIHVVEGKPEVSAEGMVALVRRAGHSITGEVSSEAVTVNGKRGDNGDTMTFTFTLEDANRAKLTGKDVWKKYPSSMLWARAVSQLGRMLFPDVLLGVSYVEGEISGADLDLDGDSFTPPPVDIVDASGKVVEMQGPEVYPADEEIDELLETIKGLSDDGKEALKAEAQLRERPGKYSWSFQQSHRWTVKELADVKAWVFAHMGQEPWDDGPALDDQVVDAEVIDDPEAPFEAAAEGDADD